MCGKFTQMASWAEVVAFSDMMIPHSRDVVLTSTPMRLAHVVTLNAEGARTTTPMRWGFVDHRPGARDIPRHMHARSETIDRLPTFAEAFAERRGLLFVDTFNEGEEAPVVFDDGEPSGRTWTRQWTVRPHDNKPLAIAVVWEWAMIQERPLATFVQITTPANALIARITDRMPAILPAEAWEVWLGETRAPLSEVKGLLKTFEDGGAWAMAPENPAKKPPRPRNPKPKPASKQGGLL